MPINKVYDTDDVNRITMTAPAGGVVAGRFYRFGRLFGQAVSTVPAGKVFTLDRKGAWSVPVEAQGAAVAVGDPIYWEAGRADAEFHRDPTDVGSFLVGSAMEAIPSGQTREILVLIEPINQAPIAA